MREHTLLGTEETMDLEASRRYFSCYDTSGSGLGSMITGEMAEAYDGYDAGKSIRQVYSSCDTEEEWQMADRMFKSLTGFTLHEITATTNHDPYSYAILCGWHDRRDDSFSSLEERRDFYFKNRSQDDLASLGAAALTSGGCQDAEDVEYGYLYAFRAATTDRQAQLCDAVGIAVTGFSFDTFLDMCGCPHEKKALLKKAHMSKTR